METNDNNGWLRDRNRKVFGVGAGKLGTAWKSGKVNDIYEDESYYIEPNFGWLGQLNSGGKKIIGGENMKSRISGIGLKITKIDGEPILGNEQNIKWNDLRGNNGWSLHNNGDIKGNKRTIRTQRVAFYEKSEGANKKIVDLGQGICMLKLPRDNGNVYLVVGVSRLGNSVTWRSGNNTRIKWDDNSKYVDEGWGVCHGIEETFGQEHTLVIDWFEGNKDRTIRVDSRSTLLIGNSEGRAVSWLSKRNEGKLVAVVLGVAVKYKNWWEEEFKTGDGNEEIANRNWVNEVKNGDNSGRGKGLELKSGSPRVIKFEPERKWESIGSFKPVASAKYTWTGRK